MAVQDNGTRIQYTATASQTVFPYPFEILDEDDITVVQNSTTLSKTTHYTVSGVGSDTGGNITFVTGATSGDVITIYRSMALSRVTNYQANAAFLESEVDADFDRLWMAMQQNESDVTRAIRASQTDSILNSTNTELAIPATRAGKVLGFDSTGALSYYASTVASADFIQVTTTAAMAALASPTVGDVVQTTEFSTGNGGGGTYDCVTVGTTPNVDLPNTRNIIVSTVDATKCFVLRVDGVMYSKRFGLKGDGSDEDAAFSAFRDYFSSFPGTKGIFQEGVYSYVTSPNWAIEKLNMEFEGDVTLKHTGTGNALIFDAGSGSELIFDFNFGWGNKPFLEGNANSDNGVYVRSCHHCKIGAKVTGCATTGDALRVEFSVLGEFDIVASVNQQPFVSKPLRGVFLSRRNVGEDTSACTFYNPIIEGVGGVGIYLDWALMNNFVAGTSEGNIGDNIECSVNSRNNTFNGIDLEVPTSGVGIRDYGRRNAYLNVLNDAKTIFEVGSQNNRIEGGIFDEITTLGSRAKLLNVDYGSVSGEIIQEFAGTHDGAGNATVLTDTSAAFPADSLVGLVVSNTTDGSTATITANTATTVTGTLSGGTDNDWDVSDAYEIIGDSTSTIKDCFDVTSATHKQVNKVQGKAHFTDVITAGAFGVTPAVPGHITKTGVVLAGVNVGDNINLVSQTNPPSDFNPAPSAVCTVKGTIDITFVQLSGTAVSPLPSGGDFTVTVDGA